MGIKLERRQFLKSIAAIGSITAAPTWAAMGSPKVLGAAKTTSGEFVIAGLSEAGQIVFQTPLPMRGHGFAAHPTKAIAVAFARRPGSQAFIINLATGLEIARLDISEFGHFYGHGVYTPGARFLLTTENDLETSEGRIGIWDAAKGYARVGSKPTGGIGPHEMIALSDGGYAVANGGILTDPTSARRKLNIATMDPSLTILDNKLNIISQHRSPEELHQLSIRHIAESRGRIGIGMQWEGDPRQEHPVVGVWQGEAIHLNEESAGFAKNYIGSVAASSLSNVGFSAPRASKLLQLDEANSFSVTDIRDIYGLCALNDGFLGTSNTDAILIHQYAEYIPVNTSLIWDNHLTTCSK